MRLLLVPYYFAPAGGPRSIRWSNLARYLALAGHELTVVSAEFPAGCPWMDESLMEVADVPGIEVHRIPIASCSPGRRENVAWMREAVRFLTRRGTSDFDAAISSAVPVVAHGVMAKLPRPKGCPWIADYGDPWSQSAHRLRPAMVKWAETQYERSLLKRADALTITTPTAVEAFVRVYPHRDRIRVIPQGASHFHLSADWSARPSPSEGPLRVLYTGGFYAGVREPRELFAGLKAAPNVHLTIVGHSQVDLVTMAREAGVADRVEVLGYADIRRIVELQREADLLLLLSWPVEEQIPGKFWEYMATSRPIFYATFHPEDGIAQRIQEAGAGYVTGHSTEAIASGLNRAANDKRGGGAFQRQPDPTVGFDARAQSFVELIVELRREKGA